MLLVDMLNFDRMSFAHFLHPLFQCLVYMYFPDVWEAKLALLYNRKVSFQLVIHRNYGMVLLQLLDHLSDLRWEWS